MSTDSEETQNIISPGATIGILGSGQLGRMMAIAAKQMGYRVHVFSPSHDSPAGQVADLEIQASYDDLASVEAFAKHVDVVTAETENIPLTTLEVVSSVVPAFPGERALAISQNRSLEKQFLRDNLFPTCNFKVVMSLSELQEACCEIMPAVLKTVTGGYDGKGQAVIRTPEDVEVAWNQLNATEAILEEWIEFDFEFSVVGVRSSTGALDAYPSIRNNHRSGILDISVSPSGLPHDVESHATEVTYEIMKKLESVGVLTVEFFYRDGEVLVNEIAPRPHNSGHLTIEGHMTDQFEQHVRAICGMEFGSTRQLIPAAMANLLGNEWSHGQPLWHFGLSVPNIKLHLYGKGIPEPERKMGHLTSMAETPELAEEHVRTARKLLTFGSSPLFDRAREDQTNSLPQEFAQARLISE